MGKRVFDIFFSVLGFMILWPVFIIISISIVLVDGFPVFFRQQRVGRFGKIFFIWKFRTMRPNSDGALLTKSGDERITKTGKVLRKYKLDELPQLFNVLIGEMSLVGPRPEVPRYNECIPKKTRDKILDLTPGITDLASIKFINEEAILASAANYEQVYIKEILPEKVSLHLKYYQEKSFSLDLKIILKTIKNIFSKDSRGA